MAYRELQNEFSWSKSRHEKFRDCRRQYWFVYYGAWGGWKESAAPEVRETYILKNLSSRQQWAGNVVHDTIRYALTMTRAGSTPPLEQLVERAHQKMRDDFRRSRRREYRLMPKKVVGLVEHEYEEPIADAEWKANWENAEACLRNFYASHWLQKARELKPEEWLPIDQIDSFLMDGVKVFAGPDFAYRDGDGVVLVDWKTGRHRDEDKEQVKGYALYAASKWKARPDQVKARLVYLGQAQEVEVSVDPDSLEGFRQYFRESVAKMRELLKDPEKNVAHKDDFPMTEDVQQCRFCPFRKMCGR